MKVSMSVWSIIMKKHIFILWLVVIFGCSSEVARGENAGTLLSIKPAEELIRSPCRLGTAIGETEIGLTRVETTEGVYVVHGKIGIVQIGTPVRVGDSSSDKNKSTPSYLSLKGQKYKIA